MKNCKKATVVGLGKLGTPLSVVLASKGFQVVGIDYNSEIVNALQLGESALEEPQLKELLQKYKNAIQATTDYTHAIPESDVTFVIVPTPSNAEGYFSNEYVLTAMRVIGSALKTKKSYHLVVIVSTVMPGSTDNEIVGCLEEASGLKIGKNIGLCYSPQFIALGSVIKNMLTPDIALIGESDSQSGDLLEKIYKTVCDNNPPIMRMNYVNAEITKLAINTFVTTKISFANMLSDLCDKLHHADVNQVTNAMGCDTRIGKKYLTAGTAYGGPCFPRDNIAFAALAEKKGSNAAIAKAATDINRHQLNRILSIISTFEPECSVGILGLAYKPNTTVVEESAGIGSANALAKRGYTVSVHDPMALPTADNLLPDEIIRYQSENECIAASDVVVVMTDWPVYQENITPDIVYRADRPRVVIDCWRSLAKNNLDSVAKVYYTGNGNFSGGQL